MEKGRTGHRYIFSTEYVSVDDLVGMLVRITGRPKPTLRLAPSAMSALAHVSDLVMPRLFPQTPRRFTAGAVRLLQMRRRADTSKARAELGLLAQRRSGTHLQHAYDWFVAQGEVDDPKRVASTEIPASAHAARVTNSQHAQVDA